LNDIQTLFTYVNFFFSCWLSLESGLLWAFAGPALLVILVSEHIPVVVIAIRSFPHSFMN